ncbi:MAG: NAD(P)H-dependent oxidoreductase [Brevinematales bacterium]|nr:NAD(P)H-dependent oxidoreductase [Brevinematales bacterium]
MKMLVLYFSYDGHNEKIAKFIEKEFKADVEKIEMIKKLPKGFFKYFIGGMMTVLGMKPRIKPLQKRIEDYDVIIMSSPVWASNFAAPFNSVVSNYDFGNKKIVLFCTYAGGGEGVFENFKRKLKNSKIILEKSFNEKSLYSSDFFVELKSILEKIK